MQLKDFLLRQLVFEARYFKGYRYLDRCGETMLDIESKVEGWSARDASPQSGNMINEEKGITFSFSSNKLNLVRDRIQNMDSNDFFSHSKSILNIVSENLGINEFDLFGVRYWFFYPVKTLEEGRKILSNCKIYSVRSDIEKIFNKSIKDTSIVIILEEENIGYRIAISIVHKEERLLNKGQLLLKPAHMYSKNQDKILIDQLKEKKKQKESQEMAILIDVDSYNKNPKLEEYDDFIQVSDKISKENLIKLLGG